MENCPNCDNNSCSLIKKENNFEVLKCDNCFSLFSNMRSESNLIDPFIDTDQITKGHIAFYKLPRFFINRYTFKVTANFDFNYITSHINLKKIKNSLDIGSQYGFLVQQLAKYGVDSHGIEAFRHSYDVCQERINYEYFTENYDSKGTKYDLITIGDLLPYNPNSTKLMKKAISMLNDGGFLVITSFNPSSDIICDILNRVGVSYLNYTSKKGYEIICQKNNCILVDFMTVIAKCFSIKLTMKDKLRVGIELLKCAFGVDNGFRKDPKGFRSYTLIRNDRNQ